MAKISSKSRACAEAIGQRKDVQTYGALSAENISYVAWPYASYSGRLSGPDLERFREDQARICYVVRSYETPIAWVTHDGRVHKVAQKFSVTTSQHQGKLYLLRDERAAEAS